ncbi:zinc-binding dehydrogenase [Nocardiopsis sp. EMB25]|uniref:zinc-binding dehydrogenase n=1 Tax=Nocardiopsis sp. EMB25 TaxID=2835867 RepID=UPI002284C54C|nr:zinc-binding dehydrogenase [Nocardiopsis sp. EMB25]MCY9787281.1 zinc-binding dehydrogenase [Nocardiopsis sp. EMB25]
MRAVRVREFGGPAVLATEEVPDPVAAPGEVVIDVTAADILFLDTLLRRGWGQDFFPVPLPYTPGSGVAGTVSSVGEGVDAAWIGTRVIAETGRGNPGSGQIIPTDGYAERTATPEERLIRVPDGLDPTHAVSLLHDGAMAKLLEGAARFEPGTWVLVAAAAGGAGSLVVQLARAAGAHVVGAARGERKLDLVRSLGADATVDYSKPGWVEEVRALTGGEGARVVLDGAGGDLGAAAFGAVADGGRFISYGTASGSFAAVDEEEAERRKVTVTGLLDLEGNSPSHKRELTRGVLELAAEGRVTPRIGTTLPLERAAEAHAGLEERTSVGKTLLVV